MIYFQTLQPIFINENYASFVHEKKGQVYKLDKGIFFKISSVSESFFFSKTTYGKFIIPGYYSLEQELDRVDISNLLLKENEDKIKMINYEFVIKNKFKPTVFDCQCTINKLNLYDYQLETCQIHKILGLGYLRNKRDQFSFDVFTKKELLNYFILTEKEYRGKSYLLPTNLFTMTKSELYNFAPHWLK